MVEDVCNGPGTLRSFTRYKLEVGPATSSSVIGAYVKCSDLTMSLLLEC